MNAKKKSDGADKMRRAKSSYADLAVHPILICPVAGERKKLAREHGVPVFATTEEFERTLLCEAARRCDEQIDRAKGGDVSGATRYLDQMMTEIRSTLWGDAAFARNLKLLVERAQREIAQLATSNARTPDPQKQKRPVVTFSNNFMTVNCANWPQSESRVRARQAQNILRSLFENWRDHRNEPMSLDVLLRDVKTERLDQALSSLAYPRAWSLIREAVAEGTGRRTFWLADSYDYRVG